MGLATIINMIVFVCVPAWGSWAAQLAWTLWWIDVACAAGTNFYLPFIVMYKHEVGRYFSAGSSVRLSAHHSQTKLSTMTAAWLLPVVATIVAAASGGVVATVLPLQHALITITVSYVLWGCGIPLALFTMVIYFQRLTMHALPPREVIVSVFLPLGPLGQGSFAIMQLGKESLRIFKATGTIPAAPMAGQIFYTAGILVALVMWGFGLVWLFFALASISRSRFPFNLGWWGFTFPLGVYAIATTTFSEELPSAFFKVLGTIFSLTVVLLWMAVGAGTIYRVCVGELIYAPCIKDWEAQKTVESQPGSKSGDAV